MAWAFRARRPVCVVIVYYYYCCAFVRARIMYGSTVLASEKKATRCPRALPQQHSNLGFHKETGSRREAAASGLPHQACSWASRGTSDGLALGRWGRSSVWCSCFRQRYTVFWPYTICQPNTKTKINRTYRHLHKRSVFFFLHVAIRNSLRSNNFPLRNTLQYMIPPSQDQVSG